jgi:hypothetical protein
MKYLQDSLAIYDEYLSYLDALKIADISVFEQWDNIEQNKPMTRDEKILRYKKIKE